MAPLHCVFFLISVNLADQTAAIITARDIVQDLRCGDITLSRKYGTRWFWEKLQPWQNGLIKSCNALIAQHAYLCQKYDMKTIRTNKLNQVQPDSYFSLPLPCPSTCAKNLCRCSRNGVPHTIGSDCF